jgi:K+-sensing histidine kinase KdpD
LQFSVRDTGLGIPREKQQLIFERFVRGSTELTNPMMVLVWACQLQEPTWKS